MPVTARVLAVCALVVASLAAGVASAAAATPLYPDLKTLPPRDLKIDRADVSVDGAGNFHNVLRFSNTVWNDGAGKLVMRGTINPSTKDGPAVQRVYDDAGGFTDYTVGRFYWHAAHTHYHYDDWGRYQLFTKAEYDSWVAGGRPKTLPSGVEVGTKTTSCVMDEEFIKTLPNTPWPAVFPSTGCMDDANGMLLEGISPGWGDTYDYWRYEQWIDLGQATLADGDYVLRSVTDDKNLLYESATKADAAREGETANEGITQFRVTGGALVDLNAPTGTVAINDVDSQTTSTDVTVKALGRDDILGPKDVAGVDTVRLSNDGATWKTYTYTQGPGSTPQAIAWNLADPAAGGTSAGGTKTVYAQFRDRSGKWSGDVTDTIVYKAPAAPTGYSQAVVADGPVSYWRLAETSGTTALDERGANTGTYRNGAVLGAAGLLSGEPANKAATFDGVNDYVSAGPSASLDLTSALTLEAWIKPTALPAAGQFASVVTKEDAYSIQFEGSRIEFAVVQPGGVYKRLMADAGAIEAGKAYHVVGTYDGATQRLYINGVEVKNAALTGAVGTNGSPVTIGSWGTIEYFNGTIDEVAVYKTALSAARVQAHTTAAGSGGTTPPPPPVSLSTPTGVTAAAASPYAIDVRWSDTNSAEENYVLERSTSSTFSSPRVVTLPAGTTTYSDSGLAPTTTYYYRVKATAGTTSSAYSATASAATPTPPAVNSYSQVVLGDGPTSYWRLSETSGTTAGDQKAANPGTYGGTPLLGQPSLLASDTQNRALGVSGDDHMRVPTSPSLNLTSALTLEAWIKPTAIPATGFASVLTKPESYSLQFNSGRLELTIIQNGVRKRLQAPSGAVVAGRAYHVVGTFDGVTQRLYLNGAPVASVALSGTATIYGMDLFVGSWDGVSEFFNGTVDDAAVYARVLSAAQVKSHYDSGVAVPAATAASAQTLAAPATVAAPAAVATVVDAPAAAAAAPAAAVSGAAAPVAAPASAPKAPARPATRATRRAPAGRKPACRKSASHAGQRSKKRCKPPRRSGTRR